VLYISDVDLTPLDWPKQPADPIPHLTEPVIAMTPYIGLGVAGTLMGIHWIISRRMKLVTEGTSTNSPDESKTEQDVQEEEGA